MNNKLIPLCCTLWLLLTATTQAEGLKIGVIEYPPHVNFDQDTLNSKSVKYLAQAFKAQFGPVEFIKLPSKRASQLLKNGAIDLLYPLADEQRPFRRLTKPLFHAIPGLCFKKSNFIPILSATDRFKDLTIGVPAGTEVVPTLKSSAARLKTIEGSNTQHNGINLLLGDLIDALYHPSPVNIYHFSNPLAKQIACSYFYGQSSGVYIGVAPTIKSQHFDALDRALNQALKVKSYEFYYAQPD